MSFYVKPGLTQIVLRNPDFGDIIRTSHGAIARTTRNGTYKVKNDSTWPVQTIFKYKFSAIQKSVAYALRTYFVAQAGKQIIIKDHLGVTINGFVLTPIPELVSVRPDCNYDIEFEFLKV
jgi:hypothetical protein